MRINFRQGIVGHQSSGFLNFNGIGNVDLVADTRPVTIAVADQGRNYIYAEESNVDNAWIGPFTGGTDYWLYWDFHTGTFERTFGWTDVEPVVQPFAPPIVDGQVWFDTSRNQQFQYIGSTWARVFYTFAAKLNTGILTSASANAPLFTGTQIGNTNSVLAGRIVRNSSGKGIRHEDGTFFNTEDQFFVETGTSSAVRLESNVFRARCDENAIAEFTIVAFSSPGEIQTAQYNDAQTTICAVLTESLVEGQVGTLVPQGVVTNLNWDFSSMDVGTPLFIENGLLTKTDPHITNTVLYPTAKPPVARVMSNNTILFEQGLGGIGPKGPTGSITNLPGATTAALGAVVLATAADNPQIPIVVGDNDPRLDGGPFASATHTHPASAITFIPTGSIAALNVQNAITELEAMVGSSASGSYVDLSNNQDVGGVKTFLNGTLYNIDTPISFGASTGPAILQSSADNKLYIYSSLNFTTRGSISMSDGQTSIYSGLNTGNGSTITVDDQDIDIAADADINMDLAGDFNVNDATGVYMTIGGSATSIEMTSGEVEINAGTTGNLVINSAQFGLDATNFFKVKVAADFTDEVTVLEPVNGSNPVTLDYFDNNTLTTGDLTFAGLTDTSITAPATGHALFWNGSDWANRVIAASDIPTLSIDFLSDVDTTTAAPTNGQALLWNGTNFVPTTLAAGVTELDDLSDVTITTPATGHVIVRDATDFKNRLLVKADISDFAEGDYATGAEGDLAATALQNLNSTSIDALSDVDTSTAAPTSGQSLTWNGTNFVPSTPVTSIDDLSDVDTTTVAPVDGDVLVYDSTNGWEPKTIYKDIPLSFQGLLPDTTNVATVMLTQKYSVAIESATTTGSHRGFAKVAPSGGDAVFELKKNGSVTPFITITIADGTTACSFVTTAETFVAGDYIDIDTTTQNGAEGVFFSLKIKDDLGA